MNKLHIHYVLERPADDHAIELLNRFSFGAARFTRAAFLIRERYAHDRELSLVAFEGDRLVGSVRQTRIVIGMMPALLLGPLVVDEHYKNRGIGQELMRRALQLGQQKGQKLVLLIGDQSYYQRFGFKPVSYQKIILPAPADPQRILLCELEAGAERLATGKVHHINSTRHDSF